MQGRKQRHLGKPIARNWYEGSWVGLFTIGTRTWHPRAKRIPIAALAQSRCNIAGRLRKPQYLFFEAIRASAVSALFSLLDNRAVDVAVTIVSQDEVAFGYSNAPQHMCRLSAFDFVAHCRMTGPPVCVNNERCEEGNAGACWGSAGLAHSTTRLARLAPVHIL